MRKLCLPCIFILCSAFLLGCSAKKDVSMGRTADVPEWYTQPPANDERYLNGVGRGRSVEAATQNALSDLLVKLSRQVESRFSSKTSYGTHGFEEVPTSEIRRDVAKIPVSHYQVVAAEQIRSDQYLVLVRSERSLFIRSLADKVSTGFREIGHRLTESKEDNALRRYRVIQQSIERARQLMPSIWILSGITSGFDAEGYRNYTLSLHSELEKQRRDLVFYLTSDFKDQSLLQPIRSGLTDEGFLVAKTRMVNLGELVSIELTQKRLYSDVDGVPIVALNITLDSRDRQGNLIASKSFSLKADGTQGYDQATSDAVDKLAERIKREGIEQVLGIGI